MVRLIALYSQPDDTGAFDEHYRDVHAPIVSRYPKVRDIRLTKLAGVAGRAAPYYLMAEMAFDSYDDLDDALSSEADARAGDASRRRSRRAPLRADSLCPRRRPRRCHGDDRSPRGDERLRLH